MFKKRKNVKKAAVRKRRTDDDDEEENGATVTVAGDQGEPTSASAGGSVLQAIQRTKKKQKLLSSIPLASTTADGVGRGSGRRATRGKDGDGDDDNGGKGGSANDQQRSGLSTGKDGPELSALGKKHQEAMQEYIDDQMGGANAASKADASAAAQKTTGASIKDEESRLYQELADQVQATSADDSSALNSTLDPDQGSSSVLVGGNTGIAEVELPPTMGQGPGGRAHNRHRGGKPQRREGGSDTLRLRRHRFGKSENSSSAIPSLSSDMSKPLNMNTGSLLPTKFNATSSGIAQSRGMTTGSRSATADFRAERERVLNERAEEEAAKQNDNVDDDRVGFEAMMASKKDGADGKAGGDASNSRSGSRPHNGGRGGGRGGYRRRSTRDDQAFRQFVAKQFGK